MRIISSAWVSDSLAEFESTCCLRTHAQLGLASADSPFDIFIFQGFEKFTDEYTKRLAESHINLHDVTKLTDAYTIRYEKLFQLMTPQQDLRYDFFCFIRWVILAEALAGEPFIHIDLDLFFQLPFARVAKLFEGLTGTFGSPCLTSVASREWLLTYKTALDELVADRDALQSSINYGGTSFRKDISSDQDLVVALESAARLPHDDLTPLHDDFQILINPLWPYIQRKPSEPMPFTRIDGIDSIDGKPVLFWHLQNYFADYVSRFATVTFAQAPTKEPRRMRLELPFIQPVPSAEDLAFQALRGVALQRIRETLSASGDIVSLGVLRFYARAWVSNWFVLEGNGRDLLSSRFWWEDGVFV